MFLEWNEFSQLSKQNPYWNAKLHNFALKWFNKTVAGSFKLNKLPLWGDGNIQFSWLICAKFIWFQTLIASCKMCSTNSSRPRIPPTDCIQTGWVQKRTDYGLIQGPFSQLFRPVSMERMIQSSRNLEQNKKYSLFQKSLAVFFRIFLFLLNIR